MLVRRTRLQNTRKNCGPLALAALALVLSAMSARGAVVERIVAVVGEKPILLSDLNKRARPLLLRNRVYDAPQSAQRSAMISQISKVVLQMMVDEELERLESNRRKISVADKEVDAALARVASGQGLTPEQVIMEAGRAGLTEQQYRDELRRQMLRVKLMNLRLQGRVRVTEDDLQKEYRDLVLEERRTLPFRAAWILVDLPSTANAALSKQKRKRAENLVQQSRSGADFAALARRFSDDKSGAAGGMLPRMTPGSLPAAADRACLALDVGEVSEPVRIAERLAIIKVLERDPSKLPSYEQAREDLAVRVREAKFELLHRQWLDTLRKLTHVEMRL
jgi:peptidyl-prolyl cis-trans isomerase SurA